MFSFIRIQYNIILISGEILVTFLFQHSIIYSTESKIATGQNIFLYFKPCVWVVVLFKKHRHSKDAFTELLSQQTRRDQKKHFSLFSHLAHTFLNLCSYIQSAFYQRLIIVTLLSTLVITQQNCTDGRAILFIFILSFPHKNNKVTSKVQYKDFVLSFSTLVISILRYNNPKY